MKKCPLCAEEIQDEAVKCKHCGEMLQKKEPWFYKTPMLVVAFLCVGPLAIPLVWLNPGFSLNKKISVTCIMLIATLAMGMMVMNSLKSLKEYYQMFNLGNM